MNGFGNYGINPCSIGAFNSGLGSMGMMGGYAQGNFGNAAIGHSSSISPYSSHEKNDAAGKIFILGGIALAAMALFMNKGKGVKSATIAKNVTKIADSADKVKTNLTSKVKESFSNFAGRFKSKKPVTAPLNKIEPTIKDEFIPASK